MNWECQSGTTAGLSGALGVSCSALLVGVRGLARAYRCLLSTDWRLMQIRHALRLVQDVDRRQREARKEVTVEHHPLIKEFPEYREQIHLLKVGDPDFRELFDEYDRLDKEIYRFDQDIEPVSDEFAKELKRRRVSLKDELYRRLQTFAEGGAA